MFRDERGSFSKEKLLNKGKGSNERHGNHHKRIFSRQTMELFFSFSKDALDELWRRSWLLHWRGCKAGEKQRKQTTRALETMGEHNSTLQTLSVSLVKTSSHHLQLPPVF